MGCERVEGKGVGLGTGEFMGVGLRIIFACSKGVLMGVVEVIAYGRSLVLVGI